MCAKTLAGRILTNFSEVKLKKTFVKVPRLKVSIGKIKKTSQAKKEGEMPFSSIINIMIKNAAEKAKKEVKEKTIEGGKSYTVVKDERILLFNGGYGTVSKAYGSMSNKAYVDYGKLFSYLGSFRAKQPYEDMPEHLGMLNKATESSSFVLADRESMDKIGRFDKYMKSPVMDMPVMALSLVPIAGLSSAEWEEIKNLMRFDPVMYTLKSKTA